MSDKKLLPSQKLKPCKVCKKPHVVKTADLERGWGETCSKQCAAILREVRKRGGKIKDIVAPKNKPKKKKKLKIYDDDHSLSSDLDDNGDWIHDLDMGSRG